MKEKSYQFINGFTLKIIGYISMIIDHFMVVLITLNKQNNLSWYNENTYTIFRIIGRFSFIIFCFLLVEGMIHTKSPIKYLARLLGISLAMDLAYFILFRQYIGNPITTLFVGGLMVYFLEKTPKYFKLLSLVPIGVTVLTALDIIPLKYDYNLYGICTIAIFYLGYKLSNLIAKNVITLQGLDEDTFMNSSYFLTLRNATSSILFITYSLIIYFLNPVWNSHGLFSNMMSIQIYSIFTCVLFMFYNGQRGYNAKWFKYSSYLFFPLHMVILYLIINFLI